jgi:hypothetical protein
MKMTHVTLTFVTLCGYGDAVVCDETVFSSPHEKVCMCGVNGTFACESFECPVPCPDALPVEGSPCSPFVGDNGVCTYGDILLSGRRRKLYSRKEIHLVTILMMV